MSARRGFTLAEMLIAMGLMSLLLGTMAILFRTGYSNVTTTNTQTQNVQIARVALETVLAEYRQSVELFQPRPDSPPNASVLHFRRLSPNQANSDFHVKYSVAQLTLFRKTWVSPSASELPDEEATIEALFSGIQRFAVRVTPGPPRRVQIDLSVNISGNDALTVRLSGLAAERTGQ